MIFPLKMIGNSSGAYDVRFIVQNTTYRTIAASNGAQVLRPTDPTVDGYDFLGWYTEENGAGELITFPFTPNKNMVVYAYLVKAVLIGFTGLSDPSGSLVWTDDIADMADYTTSAFGDYVSVSSSLDNVFPYSQISETTDALGNVFIKIPRLYIKWIRNGKIIDGIKISNARYDSDFFCPDWFKRTSTEYYDYCLIGKYEGSVTDAGSDGKLQSKSGKICAPFVSLSHARTAASNVGSEYRLYDFGMMTLYNFLCMLYYKTANIQTVWAGRTSASSIANTGGCDGVQGLNGWNTASGCVKMLGIENPYGNINKWIDNITFAGTSIYASRSASGAYSLGGTLRPNTDGYARWLGCGTDFSTGDIKETTRSYVYCINVDGGTADTYMGDGVRYASNGVNLANGGHYYMGDAAGLWYLDGTKTAEGVASESLTGARLAKME